MKKQPSWIKSAYKYTSVYWGKSQSQIIEMLTSLGIEQVRFTNIPDRFVLEFVVNLEERSVPRGVRIVTPLLTRPTDEPKKRNKELNTIHRILLNRLKSKFIGVATGVVEFEQEFMAHLIITDKDGRESTMGELLLPQYRESIDSGKNPEFKLLN